MSASTNNPMILMTDMSDNTLRGTGTTGAQLRNVSTSSTASKKSRVSTLLNSTTNRTYLKEKVFFDSIDAEFHIDIFIFQFCANMFLPFLLLFSRNRYAQGIRWNFHSIRYDILGPIAFYGSIIAFMFCSNLDQSLLGHSLYLPLMFFVVHRVVLALKYATLSTTEYNRLMACKDKLLIDEYLSQLELFSGWVLLDDLVVSFELGAASARIGAKINEIYFRIGSNFDDPLTLGQFRHWNAFLRGHERIDIDLKPAREFKKMPNGDYGITVFDVCATIIRQSSSRNSKSSMVMGAAIYFTVFLMIVLLYIPIIKDYNVLKSTVPISCFLGCASLLIWDYGKTFFFFIYIAALDVKRFLQMTNTLHSMIRLTDLMMHGKLRKKTNNKSSSSFMDNDTFAPEEIADARMEVLLDICSQNDVNPSSERMTLSARAETEVLGTKETKNFDFAMIPRIDLYMNENAIAWSYARATIQNFGDRFRCRVDSYLVFTGLLTLTIMVLALVIIASSSDRRAAYGSTLCIQTILTVTLFIAIVAVVTIIGTSVNQEMIGQCRTLTSHMMEMQSRLSLVSSQHNGRITDRKEVEDALTSMERTISITQANNLLKPFKVFGMVAQSGLTMSVLTTALSFYSVVFSFYSTSGSEDPDISQYEQT